MATVDAYGKLPSTMHVAKPSWSDESSAMPTRRARPRSRLTGKSSSTGPIHASSGGVSALASSQSAGQRRSSSAGHLTAMSTWSAK